MQQNVCLKEIQLTQYFQKGICFTVFLKDHYHLGINQITTEIKINVKQKIKFYHFT